VLNGFPKPDCLILLSSHNLPVSHEVKLNFAKFNMHRSISGQPFTPEHGRWPNARIADSHNVGIVVAIRKCYVRPLALEDLFTD
jgi:hypothetical protein